MRRLDEWMLSRGTPTISAFRARSRNEIDTRNTMPNYARTRTPHARLPGELAPYPDRRVSPRPRPLPDRRSSPSTRRIELPGAPNKECRPYGVRSTAYGVRRTLYGVLPKYLVRPATLR